MKNKLKMTSLALGMVNLIGTTQVMAHEAHVHGVGQLEIAVQDKTAKVQFHAPAESIYGFEGKAKSGDEKKILEKGLLKLNNSFFEMLSLDKRKCEVTAEHVGVETEEGT